MEFLDEIFKMSRVSHTHTFDSGDTRGALIATLGSDFQGAVAPFKHEIEELAGRLHGDRHRAAMRLLGDRQGRRPNAVEQQLIIAALAELQGDAPEESAGCLGRAGARTFSAASGG